MSDLFWSEIPAGYLEQIMQVIKDNPQHIFQVLTKRPEAMLLHSKAYPFPDNFWAGTTIENARNLPRLDVLKQVNAKTKFISFEPLLRHLGTDYDLNGIDWVITGGESGVHLYDKKLQAARALVSYSNKRWAPTKQGREAVTSILKKCRESGTHFFHKQWGGHYPEAAGRILNGRTYNEIPYLPGANKEINNQYLKHLEAAHKPQQELF